MQGGGVGSGAEAIEKSMVIKVGPQSIPLHFTHPSPTLFTHCHHQLSNTLKTAVTRT